MKKPIAAIAAGAVSLLLSATALSPTFAYYRPPAVHFTPHFNAPAPRYVAPRYNAPVQHFNRPVQHYNQGTVVHRYPGGSPGGPPHRRNTNEGTVVHQYPGGSPGGPPHKDLNPTNVGVGEGPIHKDTKPTNVGIGEGPNQHFRSPHYASYVHHGGQGHHSESYGRWGHWYGGWGYGDVVDPYLLNDLISEAIIDWDWPDGSTYFTAGGNCYFMDATGVVYAADPAACGG